MKRHPLNRALAVVLAGSALAAAAADFGHPASPPSDPLSGARAHLGLHHWADAVAELRRINATGSADWNNLMGYALRSGDVPDLEASGRFYDEALRINPAHRGALEYSGELYLMKHELPRAQSRLADLERACRGGCAEATKLASAIADYKAHGGNHIASY